MAITREAHPPRRSRRTHDERRSSSLWAGMKSSGSLGQLQDALNGVDLMQGIARSYTPQGSAWERTTTVQLQLGSCVGAGNHFMDNGRLHDCICELRGSARPARPFDAGQKERRGCGWIIDLLTPKP